MFIKQIQLALRNLTGRKLHTLINLVCLTIGLASFFLIAMYVLDELSYDTFLPHADRTYRIVNVYNEQGVGEQSSSSPFPLSEAFRNEYRSHIQLAGRVFNFQKKNHALIAAGKRFEEKSLFFADPAILEIFGTKITTGQTDSLLYRPNHVIISRSKALEYFGRENVIGDSLRYENLMTLVVEAIMEDCPSQTHFRYDFLVSFSSLNSILAKDRNAHGWVWNPCWTYIVLRNPADLLPLSTKLPQFVEKYFYDARKEIISLWLQPVQAIHLHSDLDYEIEKNSNYSNLIILIGIALFLIFNAIINYINLTTAEGINRSIEIFTKKAIGASRWAIVCQFLIESMIITLLSLILALALIELVLPLYAEITGKIFLSFLRINPWLTVFIVGTTILVGLLAGIIPALALSAPRLAMPWRPATLIGRKKGILLRRILVVWQFSISLCLILVTIGLFRQLKYVRTADLGFDYENILVLDTESSGIAKNFHQFREDLLKCTGVQHITSTNYLLGVEHNLFPYYPENDGDTAQRFYPAFLATGDFFETFRIAYLWEADSADNQHRMYINHTMVSHLGWENPTNAKGKNIITTHGRYPISGVVADFHVTSLHQPIVPFIVEIWERNKMEYFASRYIYIRVKEISPLVIGQIETVWNNHEPLKKFSFKTHRQALESQYEDEQLLSILSLVFSAISVAIAILGMFGLTVYLTQNRKVEIGIRRSIGAGIGHIMTIIFKDYLLLIVLSHLIAWPAALLLLNYTGASYTYMAALPIRELLTGTLAATLLILAAISVQIVRAAQASVAVALRYS